MKITFVYADEGSLQPGRGWRGFLLARAIERTGRHSSRLIDLNSFAAQTATAQDACQFADVIVLQGNLGSWVLPAIQRWKAHDRTILVDIEDQCGPVPGLGIGHAGGGPEGQARSFSRHNRAAAAGDAFEWGLRLVDAAMVSSERRISDWCAYTSVYHVPEYLELDRYLTIAPIQHPGVVIGMHRCCNDRPGSGGLEFEELLVRVCRLRPQVKLMIWEDSPDLLARLPLAPGQKLLAPRLSLQEWPRHLAYVDIGLAPLNGAADERHSWLPVLEYMAMRIPWLASEGPAYYPLRPYGWLVQNNPGAWERILLDMIDHVQEYRAEAAGEAYLFSLSQGVDENIEKVLSLLATIRNREAAGRLT